jgi:hypothetical protein
MPVVALLGAEGVRSQVSLCPHGSEYVTGKVERNIELASGISLEDRMINAPPDGIVDGDQVRVVSTKGRPATVSAKQAEKG